MSIQPQYRNTRNVLSIEERRKWAEERRYLERIAELMGITAYSLRSLTGIKLWEDGANHQKVVKYVENSQCHENVKLTVVNIHRLWRKGDPKGLFDIQTRMLLWHGTKRENIPRILDTGFVIPTLQGQMFGAGIYFADRITKSSNYSDSDNTFLLLCEVGLGKIYSCSSCHNDWTDPPYGFDSVKGNGKFVPDWTDNGKFMGCTIPFGKTAQCTKYPSHCLVYNEFIVYDPSRIIIRFLVEVEVERVLTPRHLVTPRSIHPNKQVSTTRRTATAVAANSGNVNSGLISGLSGNPVQPTLVGTSRTTQIQAQPVAITSRIPGTLVGTSRTTQIQAQHVASASTIPGTLVGTSRTTQIQAQPVASASRIPGTLVGTSRTTQIQAQTCQIVPPRSAAASSIRPTASSLNNASLSSPRATQIQTGPNNHLRNVINGDPTVTNRYRTSSIPSPYIQNMRRQANANPNMLCCGKCTIL